MFIGEVASTRGSATVDQGYVAPVAAAAAGRRARGAFRTRAGSPRASARNRRPLGQIQGVWVHPDRRGHRVVNGGDGRTGCRGSGGRRIASLYVNSLNTVASERQARIGFSQVGTFATVLLD